jgi:hypothetical protein
VIADAAVYMGGALLIYYVMLVGALTGYRGSLFLIPAIIALGCIAIFRGAVGTDTAMYEAIIELSRSPDYDWGGREPGFVILAEILSSVIESNAIVIRAYAVIFVVGLLVVITRADKDERFFILAYFIPAQFFDYSMNVLRIGLATIFILLGMQFLRRGYLRGGVGYFVASLFFHYSTVVSICYLFASARVIDVRKGVFLIFFLVLMSGGAWLFLGDYLVAKFFAYSDYQPPGDFSGLSDLIVLSVLIVGALFSSLSSVGRSIFIATTVVFVVGALVLSRYTVAGMRVLDLLAVITPVSLLVIHGQEARALNWKIKLSFLLAGALGAIATLRNFLASSGQGRSPWIPYDFIF